VIPPGRGGFGEIVANAPLLLERLATLTEQLNTILGPENQQELAGILATPTADRRAGRCRAGTDRQPQGIPHHHDGIQPDARCL
jgi:hypothetical protein